MIILVVFIIKIKIITFFRNIQKYSVTRFIKIIDYETRRSNIFVQTNYF